MRRWLERAVIGLNLCPFARPVYEQGTLHIAVCLASEPADVLDRLRDELADLARLAPVERETTLLVAPRCLAEFLDFNDFLARADRLLRKAGWRGVLQLASFHPHYQFADAAPDAVTHCSNRAPYPTLHLLREDSVERAVGSLQRPEAIYERNLRTLQLLGHAGWAALDVGPGAAGRPAP